VQRADAVIIGGGLAGCATATYLAQGGASVVLLEQKRLNAGASGQNAGSLHFQLEHRLIQHADALGEQLDFYVALARRAIDDWRRLPQELGEDIELAMHGGLMVAESAEQVAKLEKKAAIEARQGLEVQLLDGDAARRLAPYLGPTIQAALLCPDEGHCNPRLLTGAYARAALAAGAQLHSDTAVTALRRVGGHWRVRARKAGSEQTQEWQAQHVINTAGAWAAAVGRLANIHLPVFPVALTMSVTEKLPPVLHHLIQHIGRKLSMKQVEDGNLLIGGGWSARLAQRGGEWHPDLAASVDLQALRGNLATAAEVVPAVAPLSLLRTWTGTTGITPDQLPIIGEVGAAPGFYVATGGSGFTYGPTYARLLAEKILTGDSSLPLTPYSPDRFGHMNMFMGQS
jgi:glycine/D-amino acid oxidase-like deaminating enzyme